MPLRTAPARVSGFQFGVSSFESLLAQPYVTRPKPVASACRELPLRLLRLAWVLCVSLVLACEQVGRRLVLCEVLAAVRGPVLC